MSDEPALDVSKQVRSYITILVSLIVLTLVTVGVSQAISAVQVRIAVCVAIALVQGFLSVAYLMHLKAEKKFVYAVLILTVFFFVALIFLPILADADRVVNGNVS